MTASDLFNQFRADLPHAIQSLHAGGNDGVWTQWVYDYFSMMGETRGFKVRRTDAERQEKQFLVDLCWINESETDYSMELALECEWGEKAQVLYDFSKLIHLRAAAKIMVCALSESSKEALLQEAQTKITRNRFKVIDEQYLVINLPRSEYADQTATPRHGRRAEHLGATEGARGAYRGVFGVACWPEASDTSSWTSNETWIHGNSESAEAPVQQVYATQATEMGYIQGGSRQCLTVVGLRCYKGRPRLTRSQGEVA